MGAFELAIEIAGAGFLPSRHMTFKDFDLRSFDPWTTHTKTNSPKNQLTHPNCDQLTQMDWSTHPIFWMSYPRIWVS